MNTRVLVIGEVLIDVVRSPDGTWTEHVGGSPANVATGLARLRHQTDFATTFGRDARGADCLAHMKAHGVEVLPSSRTGDPTSVADATIDETGAATYRFDLHWNLQRVPLRSGVGHLHTGSIAATETPGASMVLSTLVEARPDATISYDPNARPSIMGDPDAVRGHMEAIIALSDLVKASDDDVGWLYPGRTVEDVLEHWHTLGASFTVVTLGSEGVVYRAPSNGEVCRASALVADASSVVDTVGAGDSFMAGLVSGLLDAGLLGSVEARSALAEATADEVRPAVERALTTSAVTVRHHGAYSPTRHELIS